MSLFSFVQTTPNLFLQCDRQTHEPSDVAQMCTNQLVIRSRRLKRPADLNNHCPDTQVPNLSIAFQKIFVNENLLPSRILGYSDAAAANWVHRVLQGSSPDSNTVFRSQSQETSLGVCCALAEAWGVLRKVSQPPRGGKAR